KAVNALKNAVDARFIAAQTAGPVTVRDLVNNVLVNNVPVLSPGTSANPFEFNVSLPIDGTEEMVPITFDGTKLRDKFALKATSTANVINVSAHLNLNFSFGLDAQGHFYEHDAQLVGQLVLGEDTPIRVPVDLGPLSLALQDGRLDLNLQYAISAPKT